MPIPRRSIRPCLRAAARLVAAVLCSAGPVAAQQGYVIVGDQVRVDRASHWRAWQGAVSVIDIAADGSIRPLRLRKDVNAALDAGRFAVSGTPGGIVAGSNPSTARFAIDGDPATSWGPDPAAPLSDWWLEIDLGRLVVVRRVIVRFVDADEGDPLLQFKVLGWRHPPPRSTTKYTLAGTQIPRFWEIGRTLRPNKSERVFEFVPRPTEGADAAFLGDPLDRIQLIATHSDTSRAFEVTQAEWQALPADRRGAVDHYRLTLAGGERRVSQAEYESFPPERRGPVRYYRHERPRIAEVEVITAGDNLNLGLLDRGGDAVIETSGGDLKAIGAVIADGDYNKGHNGSIFDKQYEYLEDLGGLFWLDTMHFLTDGASAIGALSVDVSDGSRAPDGSIRYRPAAASDASTPPGHSSSGGIRFREIRMDPGKVRYLRAHFGNPLSSLSYIGFTEVLLYGEGYVPEVQLTSDLIRLGQSRSLVSIDWDGDTPEATRIALQTRTGDALRESTIYHDADGLVVTESRYNRLPTSKRGEVTTTFEPGDGWSPWSVAYARRGDEIVSPSPRRYLQLRASLETDRVDAAAVLRSITVRMADPVAEQLLGEVWPLRVERVGEPVLLSLFVRPTFATGGTAAPGFDELRLQASAGTRLELVDVRGGSDADMRDGTGADLGAVDTGSAADTLQVRLARRVTGGTAVVELRFRATVYGNSASFRGFVRDGAAGHWQRVDAGDATSAVHSDQVTVLALAGTEVLTDLRLDAAVFSPNGDGVNDELVARFTVTRVSAARPVTLTVHDLTGREVRRLTERRDDARGGYVLRWDGTDEDGRLVPPGTYVARVDVAVDGGARATSALRVVRVAY